MHIRQALEKLGNLKGEEATKYHADTRNIICRPRTRFILKIEELIWHFKIVMGESEIPAGEVYNAVEGGNGELGFYLISDGGRTPYRLHFGFLLYFYQAFEELVKGSMISDGNDDGFIKFDSRRNGCLKQNRQQKVLINRLKTNGGVLHTGKVRPDTANYCLIP